MEMHSDTARDWPVLAVPLPQTAEELRGKARHFAATEILPYADEIERTGDFPPDLWTKLAHIFTRF